MTPAQALAAHGNNKAAAARALGIATSTFKDRLRREAAPRARTTFGLRFPDIPDKREPDDTLIRRRTEHYERVKAHRDAATWQQIKVGDRKPIGLVLVGDPHLDDDGCAWRDLLADIKILKQTDGLYGINIGDSSNNWVGRLARLFGNQETSQTSARQLVEWFLLKSGIRWAAVLTGNHDQWNEGGEIIRRMCARSPITIPVHEWQAKLEFVFPNGATFRGNFSHDFKGRSIYSTTHGPLREAIWFQDGAHLFAAGHIHYGGIQQIELPGGHNPWLVRVRGYKDDDDHALVNGFHEGSRFRSVMVIIDPNAPEHERCAVFGSLRQGAAVLEAMRRSNGKGRQTGSARRGGRRSMDRPPNVGAARPRSRGKARRSGGAK